MERRTNEGITWQMNHYEAGTVGKQRNMSGWVTDKWTSTRVGGVAKWVSEQNSRNEEAQKVIQDSGPIFLLNPGFPFDSQDKHAVHMQTQMCIGHPS